ncbi:MLP-like protein 43 [Citrus sinensis]|uniref:MLP-like protein 28 isoform X2 n=1 Tax=Citrus sinensis TaxID=2711 RepID=UPI0003D76194|nr:MLP-like protein 28 isoform X2 [Citrus sinensis]KAH9746315.1 MLP-like protein 43 [Citrus sinensis]
MSLTGQVEAGVEIKAPASTVREYFCSKLHHVSSACPDKVQSVDLLEGEWGKAGSVIFGRYANGNLLDQYKSFCCFFQVTPKGEGSFVTWTLKYEKPNENVPEPAAMLQLCVDVTKDVAAKLIPQA